ncbi:MAG: RNA polymerase sigma factor [Planctomycetota bacterium JB042]
MRPHRDAPASPYEDDLELRARILRGDRAAAERLFERHVDALFEFVHYRAGGDRGVAEAVVQESFLTAYEGLAGYEGRSSLHTWLCGIAKNKLREHRRKKRPIPLDDLLDRVDPEIDLILMGIETEEIPEAVIERRETRELVGATLSSLPPDYRSALLQKYVDDLSVREIAARAGKGQKAIESTLFRARTAFARVFTLLARRRGGEP